MRLRPLCQALAVASFLAALPSICFGQAQNITDTTSTPVPGVGHDYLKILNETVNPATGAVSLRIRPPVPKSRGITIPFSIAYDSTAAWFLNPGGPGTAVDGATQLGNQGPMNVAGWSITLPHLTRFVSTYTDPNGMRSDGSTTCSATTGYMFTDGSGTPHSLGVSNVFNYNIGAPPHESIACQDSRFRNVETGGDSVYRAALVGASQEFSSDGTAGYSDGTPTIAGPDGTVYTFGCCWLWWDGLITDGGISYGFPTSIQDTNGNAVSISTNSGVTTLRDTLGRAAVSITGVPLVINTNPPTTTATVSGLGSPYTLNWGTVSSSPGLQTSPVSLTGDSHCGTAAISKAGYGGTAMTTMTLPNGKQYVFSYDATSGFLSKVTFPSGGYVSYSWGINPLSASIIFSDTNGVNNCQYHYGTPAVTHRYVSFDGSTIALQQDFSYSTTWRTENGLYLLVVDENDHGYNTRPRQRDFLSDCLYIRTRIRGLPYQHFSWKQSDLRRENHRSVWDELRAPQNHDKSLARSIQARL